MDELIKILSFKRKNYIYSSQDSISTKIKTIAADLRNIVLSMPTQKIPKHEITEKDIEKGECDIPPQLYLLIESLLLGNKARDADKDFRKHVKIKAICDSIIYCNSNGHIKPSNHQTICL